MTPLIVRVRIVTQTITLPTEVHRKLAQGAAERGMTIESLLTAVSEVVATSDIATEVDRQRHERIEKLLDHFRSGQIDAGDRRELDDLIQADYRSAIARAEGVIKSKKSHAGNEGKGKRNGASKSDKRSKT